MKKQVADTEEQYQMEVENGKEMKTQYEAAISSLNHDLEKQRAQMDEMEERITSQSITIESLNHKITTNQELEKEMNGILEEKNHEIEVLKSNLMNNQKQLEERIEELAKQKEMIVSMTMNDQPTQQTPVSDKTSIEVSHDSQHSIESTSTSLLHRCYLIVSLFIEVENESDRLLVDVTNGVTEGTM